MFKYANNYALCPPPFFLLLVFSLEKTKTTTQISFIQTTNKIRDAFVCSRAHEEKNGLTQSLIMTSLVFLSQKFFFPLLGNKLLVGEKKKELGE